MKLWLLLVLNTVQGLYSAVSGSPSEDWGKLVLPLQKQVLRFSVLLYTLTQPLIAKIYSNILPAVATGILVVSSPDQIFRARPADSSKNRVWTPSLRKLGQVYIWRAVNWVIVGVNYIISNQQRLLWRQKNCKLAIYDDA